MAADHTHSHAHSDWPMNAEVLLDGKHYGEIRSIEDGEAWITGRAGDWSVRARARCCPDIMVLPTTEGQTA